MKKDKLTKWLRDKKKTVSVLRDKNYGFQFPKYKLKMQTPKRDRKIFSFLKILQH